MDKKKSDKKSKKKKAYDTPRLTRYRSLKDLAKGSGSATTSGPTPGTGPGRFAPPPWGT